MSASDREVASPVARHRFLRWLLPERAFAAVEAGTRQWLIECKCGHKRDFWDAGGVRWKAVGEPRQYLPCRACGRSTWHRIRKKTPEERRALAADHRAPETGLR